MEEIDIKSRGANNYNALKTHNDKKRYSRSNNYYDEKDKARGLRRIADRHCHHRRRQNTNESLIYSFKTDNEPILQISTTCIQKRKTRDGSGNVSNNCSNSKS